MIPKDKERFAKAMAIMGTAFQKQPPDTLTDVYWRVLQDMPIETFEQATLNLINTRTITGTFPMVAEIREAVKCTSADLDSRIAVAWDKVLYALGRHGHLDTLIFDDPIIHAILKSWGGWLKWSQEITNDQLKWARKDFAALYKAYVALPLPAPEPFEGLIGIENRNAGYIDHVPAAIYITGTVGAFKSLPYQESEEPRRIEHA